MDRYETLRNDTFVDDPRTSKPERQQGERFTESRPKFLSVVPRTNFPEEIDLEPYTPEERDKLARVALWTAVHEHDSRFLETVSGVGRHPLGELNVLLRIRLTVFMEDVVDVLRSRMERLAAEAKEEAEAF